MTSDRAASGTVSRRRYSAQLQAQVMAECDAPGGSVAKVAMSHGINANVVRRDAARDWKASQWTDASGENALCIDE